MVNEDRRSTKRGSRRKKEYLIILYIKNLRTPAYQRFVPRLRSVWMCIGTRKGTVKSHDRVVLVVLEGWGTETRVYTLNKIGFVIIVLIVS